MTVQDKRPESEPFLQSVRNALAHLYDDAYLQSQPLAFETGGKFDQATRAQRLRSALLDAIEQLRPRRQTGAAGSSARAYAILSYRYLDGLSTEEVAAKLALSTRQVYREHDKGVKAIASLLHERLGTQTQGSTAVAGPPERSAAARAEIERLRQAAHPETLDPIDIVQDAIQLVRPLTQERGVLVTVAPSGNLPQIAGDRVMLRQALASLLSLAAASLSSGELLVRLSPSEGNLLASIETSGACDHPLESSQNVEVVQGLLEALGGSVEIQVGHDRQRIRVVLPALAKAAVLVIDDNPDLISLVQRYLAGYAISVVGATNGVEALHLSVDLRPQAILLDVMIPSQDGWEILRRLKSLPETRDIPIVVCSVLNEPYLARAMGASDYITKPITQAGLLDALRPWLRALQPAL